MDEASLGWVLAVNGVIWVGFAAYAWKLTTDLSKLEKRR